MKLRPISLGKETGLAIYELEKQDFGIHFERFPLSL
jgi:hypothetical protein